MENLRKRISQATDTFYEITIFYLAVIVSSALAYSYLEDKPIWDSFWWACVTGLTIGYGDLYPVTVGGRIVALFLMHVVPLVIIPLIVARLLNTIIEDAHQFSHEEQEEIKECLREVKEMLKAKHRDEDTGKDP